MPKFTDSESKLLAVKPGDYILQVLTFDKKLSKGGKTSGSDLFELKIGVEVAGKVVSELYENLIDHESCFWKWDTFLKSCGVKIAKDEPYTAFKPDSSESVRFIQIIGLRGWATLRMKPPRNAEEAEKYNEVAVWITNKEKLTPVPQVETEPAEDDIPF